MTGALIGLFLPAVALWLAMAAWRVRGPDDSRAVGVAIAIGGGLGLASLSTIWFATAGLSAGPAFVGVDALLWLSLASIALWRLRSRGEPWWQPRVRTIDAEPLTTTDWLVRGVFVVIVVLAGAAVMNEYLAAPHGQWDAWAVWNQKARFLLRGGADWGDVFSVSWSNPGHPMLVSASVARLWAYSGTESTLVPAGLALVFGGAAVTAVMGSLGLKHTRAWVAGSVLIAPGIVVQQVTSQQADIPVAFFIVATLVVLIGPGGALRCDRSTAGARFLLAGMVGGLAAWTKNEGLFFVAVATLLVLWWALPQRRPMPLGWWTIGAAPALLTVAWLKLALAPVPPTYLMEAQTSETILGRLVGPESLAILGAFAQGCLEWGGPLAAGILPITIAGAVLVSVRHPSAPARSVVAVVVLMLVGYLGVSVLTPLDAAQLIRDTFDRFLTQLWPALVFAAFSTGDSGRS